MSDKNEPIKEIVWSDRPLDGRKAATETDIYLFALAFAGESLLNWVKDEMNRYDREHPELTEFTMTPDNFDKAIAERMGFFGGRIKKFCDTKAVRAIDLYVVADKIAKRMEEMDNE